MVCLPFGRIFDVYGKSSTIHRRTTEVTSRKNGIITCLCGRARADNPKGGNFVTSYPAYSSPPIYLSYRPCRSLLPEFTLVIGIEKENRIGNSSGKNPKFPVQRRGPNVNVRLPQSAPFGTVVPWSIFECCMQ